MGCKFSSTKERDPPSQKTSVKEASHKPPPAEEAAEPEQASSKDNTHHQHVHPYSPTATTPHGPLKHATTHEVAAADENALEEDSSGGLSPVGSKPHATQEEQQQQQRKGDEAAEDGSDGEDGSGDDLNGSFAHIDLNGSFHIQYTTKGDIIPNATLPEARRGRSVTPKLLAALSPHPSDDELVLLCTDCGMTIDESCEALCPLTGKVHV